MGLWVGFWDGITWGRGCPRLYSVAALRLKKNYSIVQIAKIYYRIARCEIADGHVTDIIARRKNGNRD